VLSKLLLPFYLAQIHSLEEFLKHYSSPFYLAPESSSLRGENSVFIAEFQ